MKRIVGCLAALLLASAVCAQAEPKATAAAAERFKDWAVEPIGPFFGAYTTNETGAVFGLLCGSNGCTLYVNTLTECDEKGDYIGMLNGGAGAFDVKLKCNVIPAGNDKRYLLLIDDSVPSAEFDGKQVGFAMPMDDGAFGLHMFSTDGSQPAIARAMALAGFNPKARPKSAKSE